MRDEPGEPLPNLLAGNTDHCRRPEIGKRAKCVFACRVRSVVRSAGDTIIRVDQAAHVDTWS